MVDSIHFVIVGVSYIIASVIIYLRGRKNLYDKGISWVLFSFFHGLDELLDGLSGLVNFDEGTHLLLEKLELSSIYLASIFLMMTIFIQLGLISARQQGLAGILTQAPVIILFLALNDQAIGAIVDTTTPVFGKEVKLFIFILSVIPAILLVLAYFSEAVRLSLRNVKLGRSPFSHTFPIYMSGLMMVLYTIGETLADVNVAFLYLEIVSIGYIMLAPIEVNFGTDGTIQFFLIYHEQGLPLMEVRFNNKLTDDTLMLISGLLGAVNTLVGSELKMGNLRQIETESGYLLFEKRGEFVYAVLTQSVSVNINEKFSGLIEKLEKEIGDNVDVTKKNEELSTTLEGMIIQDLSVWV